jgi:hypothetical protein
VAKKTSAKELESWVRKLQIQTGAAPATSTREKLLGGSESTAAYMGRVDAAFRVMQDAVTQVAAKRPPQTQDGWAFINDWFELFGKWSAFYMRRGADPNSDTDLAVTTVYVTGLENARKQYKERLGEAPPPPPSEPLKPAEDPLFPSNPLDSLVSLAKWGTIGYFVFLVGSHWTKDKGSK